MIVVSGEVDISSVPALRDAIFPWVEAQLALLVVDLSEVSFLDSTALNALVAFHKRFESYDGELRIVAGHPMVRRLFAVTGVDQEFTLFDTVQDAVAREPTTAA